MDFTFLNRNEFDTICVMNHLHLLSRLDAKSFANIHAG